MRNTQAVLFSLLGASLLATSVRANLTPANTADEQLSDGTSPQYFTIGYNTVSTSSVFVSGLASVTGVVPFAGASLNLFASEDPQPAIAASAFVLDTYSFIVKGPTRQVAVDAFSDGDAFAEAIGPASLFGQSFVGLTMTSAAAQDPDESLSKLNLFQSATANEAGSSDVPYSFDEEFVADTNVLYTVFLYASTTATRGDDATGETTVDLSAFIDAAFTISADVPNPDAYTIDIDPGANVLSAIPEPSSYGMLAAGGLMGAALLRRKRRASKS